MARINLDDDELATIAQCFAQVEDMLNSHGITVVKDRELTSVLAGALIKKFAMEKRIGGSWLATPI